MEGSKERWIHGWGVWLFVRNSRNYSDTLKNDVQVGLQVRNPCCHPLAIHQWAYVAQSNATVLHHPSLTHLVSHQWGLQGAPWVPQGQEFFSYNTETLEPTIKRKEGPAPVIGLLGKTSTTQNPGQNLPTKNTKLGAGVRKLMAEVMVLLEARRIPQGAGGSETDEPCAQHMQCPHTNFPCPSFTAGPPRYQNLPR